MATFIPGLELAEAFYQEAVRPILQANFSSLSYSAALIGSGSEVLGFDNEMSCDHHWGPRVMLFMEPNDLSRYQTIIKSVLSQKLPRRFKGYPTSYTASNLADKGTQLFDFNDSGPINHRVELLTIRGYFNDYIGFDVEQEMTPADWLTFPQQKLRSIVAGRVFYDNIGLIRVREKLAYYPHDVWLYLLASCWARIEQDEHLMGRASNVGDEIGSAIIGARLVRDIMRLCFTMEKQYAPYAKWFGVAFKKLYSAKSIAQDLKAALSARTGKEREKHLVKAYEFIAQMHNTLKITEPMPVCSSNFFDRPFLVISKGQFSKAIRSKISDPAVQAIAACRLIGNIDLVSDNTDLLEDASWRTKVRHFYEA